MYELCPPREIKYVFTENFVERIILADGRVLSVDKFPRTDGDPSPQQMPHQVVDRPALTAVPQDPYSGAERRHALDFGEEAA